MTEYKRERRIDEADDKRGGLTPPDARALSDWRHWVAEVQEIVRANRNDYVDGQKIAVEWDEGGWGSPPLWHLRVERDVYVDTRRSGGTVWTYGSAPADATVREIVDAARILQEEVVEISIRAAHAIDEEKRLTVAAATRRIAELSATDPVLFHALYEALGQYVENTEGFLHVHNDDNDGYGPPSPEVRDAEERLPVAAKVLAAFDAVLVGLKISKV